MGKIFSIFATLVLIACTGQQSAQAQQEDPLSLIGARSSEGAAPGYVDDSVCRRCHVATYDSYQRVGMAQSLRRADTATPIETFGKEYFHAPLERYYQISKTDGGLVFRRFQRDTNDEVVNEIEIPIAWVIGSGNRARSYFYQTDWGELYMLPLSWYSEEQHWAMSPGYEKPGHPGIHRKVTKACMFCHNAYPEVPKGSDSHWAPDTFPHALPEGTGCQRCHGPGAEHIRTALSGSSLEAIHGAIVNPGKLTGQIRDSVCFQCHMLPSASLEGARRFAENVYSFRPGSLLSDYLVHVDIEEEGERPEDRFEINHHGYRFYQSECYRKSAGALSCISCHDPHLKPNSKTFRTNVRAVCVGCHTDPAEVPAHLDLDGTADCITCHMPRRRTSDVIHVTMTDHRIASGPFNLDALVEPLEKPSRRITSVSVLDFGDPPTGQEAEAYRSLAAIRAGLGLQEAQRALEQALKKTPQPESELPYMDLAAAQFNAGRHIAAGDTARKLIGHGQHLLAAHTILGTSLLAQGKREEAIRSLHKALELGEQPDAHYSLGAAYAKMGDYNRAKAHISAAIEIRPYMVEAWKYRARLAAVTGRPEQARDALIRVLQLDPMDLPAYEELARLLLSMNEGKEADRYLHFRDRMAELTAE